MPTVESPQEAIKHSISTEFSRTPGPRFAKEGSFSGEEFRNLFLSKWFEEATAAGVKLAIDFDGVYGYAPSFIEEAFGGQQEFTAQMQSSKFWSLTPARIRTSSSA